MPYGYCPQRTTRRPGIQKPQFRPAASGRALPSSRTAEIIERDPAAIVYYAGRPLQTPRANGPRYRIAGVGRVGRGSPRSKDLAGAVAVRGARSDAFEGSWRRGRLSNMQRAAPSSTSEARKKNGTVRNPERCREEPWPLSPAYTPYPPRTPRLLSALRSSDCGAGRCPSAAGRGRSPEDRFHPAPARRPAACHC